LSEKCHVLFENLEECIRETDGKPKQVYHFHPTFDYFYNKFSN